MNRFRRTPSYPSLVSGYFTQYNGEGRSRVARANEDGSLDTTFAPAGGAGPLVGPYIQALALQSDGKVLVGGVFTTFDNKDRKSIARLNSNGTLDESFNAGEPGEEGNIFAIDIQADGKVYAGGYFDAANIPGHTNLVRLNADGSVDSSFTAPEERDEGARSARVGSPARWQTPRRRQRRRLSIAVTR